MNDLMSWANLGTLAGATAAVLVIVQYVKPLLPNIHTRLMTLILSLIVLVAATAVVDGGVQEYGLAVLNAFLVASAAMGAYEISFKAGDERKKLQP